MVFVALLVAFLGLFAALLALRRTRPAASPDGTIEGLAEGLPGDVAGLRNEVAALRAEASGALRHLAVVRYDAFGDMGGRLSWSLALLDDRGDGVVVSSVHGRSEARTYAKNVAGWASEQTLSPEETDAIKRAKRS